MLTQDDVVSIMIDSKAHDNWESYSIDSDLKIPADAWQVTVGLKDKNVPSFVAPWSAAEIKVGNDTVMFGRVDSLDHSIEKNSHNFTMGGRDYAGILVDCAAPIFTSRELSLEEVVAKVVRPLGIKKIKIEAQKTKRREKISVDPGSRAWDVLSAAAEANGLWPWFSPDGTLIVGGPDYQKPSVATLVLRKDGSGNCNRIDVSQNAVNHFSELTVLGQAHGTEAEEGKHAIKAKAKDSFAGFYRPQVVLDHEVDNAGFAKDRARKLLSDGMLSVLDITVIVPGHRTESGLLWEPGQRVQLESEPHGIRDVFFLMGRRFTKSRSAGTQTELRLKQDGLWVLDAYPHQRKKRRSKKSLGTGQVIDLSN